MAVALLVPWILESVLLARHPEATDPVARREAVSVTESGASWGPLFIVVSFAALALFMDFVRRGWSFPDLWDFRVLWLVVLLTAAGILRHRRALRERDTYGQPVSLENKPIDPR